MITDVDVAKVDGEVFNSTVFGMQRRCAGGNGVLAGTQFSATGVDFNAYRIAAGCVIQLASIDGMINGIFEVVSVVDSGHLTVSQLRNNSTDAAIPVATASGLIWSIKTLEPQIVQAELELSARLGLKPGKPDALYALSEVQNTDAVKQILTALLLMRVYTALYTASTEAGIRAGYGHRQLTPIFRAAALTAGRQGLT